MHRLECICISSPGVLVVHGCNLASPSLRLSLTLSYIIPLPSGPVALLLQLCSACTWRCVNMAVIWQNCRIVVTCDLTACRGESRTWTTLFLIPRLGRWLARQLSWLTRSPRSLSLTLSCFLSPPSRCLGPVHGYLIADIVHSYFVHPYKQLTNDSSWPDYARPLELSSAAIGRTSAPRGSC